MMKNRVLSYLILMVMILSVFIAVPTFAAYSDNVLLEYDFENYTGSAPSKDDEKGVTLASLPSQNQSKKLFSRTEGGNTYLYTDYAATKKLYEDAGSTFSWGNVGFQLKFDETFTAGKYAVSFDFALKEDALPEGYLKSFMMRTAVKRVDDKYAYLFAANADNAKVYGYKSNAKEMFDTAGTYGGPVSITPGQVSRVDIVFDLDSKYSEESDANGVVSGYVDGQLFTRKEFTDGLYSNNLNFYLLQEVAYFDNLKVAKIEADSFEADATYANNTATISFTESLLTEETALDASDFTVTNTATGEAVEVASAAKTAYDEVELTFAEGAIKKGFTYNVEFSTNVKNIAGNNVANAVSFTLPADGKTAYTEEFADFNTGNIKVDDLANRNHNNFYLMYNQAQIDADSVRFKEPQAIVDEKTDAIRVIRSASTNANSDMTVQLPHRIYFEGDVTLEYRIRVSEDLPLFRTYLSPKNEMGYQLDAGNTIPSIYYSGGKVCYVKATTTNQGTPVESKSGEIGAAWHVYKAVYHFDEETVDFYFDGEPLNTTPQTISNWDKMKVKGNFGYVDMRITGTEGAYVDIDYIKVTQAAPAPYVKNIAYKDYQGNATTAGIKEIAVSFGGNVSESSLENIAILDGETPVKYDGAFDATTRTYTMTIPSLLAGGKTYSLDLAAVADPYAAAIVGEKEVAIATTAGTKEPLTVTFSKTKAEVAAGDKVVITATIIDTTGACAENYALIGAVNNGGTLSNVDLATLTWDGFVGTAKANITVESTDELSIKAFVLESLSTLAPVALSPFELN